MNKSLGALARFRNNSYVENIGIAAGRKVVKSFRMMLTREAIASQFLMWEALVFNLQ
jgi:hypothetical protein